MIFSVATGSSATSSSSSSRRAFCVIHARYSATPHRVIMRGEAGRGMRWHGGQAPGDSKPGACQINVPAGDTAAGVAMAASMECRRQSGRGAGLWVAGSRLPGLPFAQSGGRCDRQCRPSDYTTALNPGSQAPHKVSGCADRPASASRPRRTRNTSGTQCLKRPLCPVNVLSEFSRCANTGLYSQFDSTDPEMRHPRVVVLVLSSAGWV
jgi:hypothetical protein